MRQKKLALDKVEVDELVLMRQKNMTRPFFPLKAGTVSRRASVLERRRRARGGDQAGGHIGAQNWTAFPTWAMRSLRRKEKPHTGIEPAIIYVWSRNFTRCTTEPQLVELLGTSLAFKQSPRVWRLLPNVRQRRRRTGDGGLVLSLSFRCLVLGKGKKGHHIDN